MEVGGVIDGLEELSFFSGCVIRIESQLGLLAAQSVIGAENLKIN